MQYRAQDANGDYTFGQNGQNFYVNSPQGVGQAVYTKLRLWAGEWFLDNSQGVPWLTNVVGYGTQPTYDQVIRDTISDTEGVSSIDAYSSVLDPLTRNLTVTANLTTIYGQIPIVAVLSDDGGFGIGPYGLRPFGG